MLGTCVASHLLKKSEMGSTIITILQLRKLGPEKLSCLGAHDQ